MGINQFKTYALTCVCEGMGYLGRDQREDFTLKGWTYSIIRRKGGWELEENYQTSTFHKSLPKLFRYIFKSRWISYN